MRRSVLLGTQGVNHFNMTKRGGKPPKPPTPESRPSNSAFDVWLQRGLHQLYDDVAREPVPEELLRLIKDGKDEKDK